MTLISNNRQKGISLIEALIGLAIISLGLLSIAKLYGELVESSGQTKARAEAVQLAEGTVEELRAAMVRDDFERLLETESREDVPGTNAIFRVDPRVTWSDADENRLDIRVSVSWTDARDEAQEVVMASSVAWLDPKIGGDLARGRLSTGETPIPRPTGLATTGDDNRGVFDDDFTAEDYDVGEANRLRDLADSIGVEIKQNEGALQVVDTATGFPLLTTRNAPLGSVSGRVFVENGQNDGPENWRVVSSDAAFCGTEFDEDGMFTEGLPYFNYVCFFGQGWFGNIGIIRDEASLEERVCVGETDPSLRAGYGPWDNVEIQRSPIRRYRGFEGDEDGVLIATYGLGDEPVPLFFAGHDFLQAELRGQTSCQDKVDSLPDEFRSAFSGSGNIAENEGDANPARNVCMIGPGNCLDDGDQGALTTDSLIVLRFKDGEESGGDVREIMSAIVPENPERMVCQAQEDWDLGPFEDEFDEGDGEVRVTCLVTVPDADTWSASVSLEVNQDGDRGITNLFVCEDSESVEKTFVRQGPNGSISIDVNRQGQTRLSSGIDFSRIPSGRETIVFPAIDPEITSYGPALDLCVR